jgi:hypothetical protein
MSHVRPNKSELALPTEASEVTSWHWRVGSKITKRTKVVSERTTGRANKRCRLAELSCRSRRLDRPDYLEVAQSALG